MPATSLPNAAAVLELIQGHSGVGPRRTRETHECHGRRRSFPVVHGPSGVGESAEPALGISASSPRTGAPSECASLAAALTMFCVLAPPRVHALLASRRTWIKDDFKGDPAQRVRAIASHMGKFGYDPFDLKLQVQAAMQFAIERARPRQVALAGRDARCRRCRAPGEEAGSETRAVGPLRGADP